MQTIKINPDKIIKEEINLIVKTLKQGKVIVYPTDTIYGLGCLANNTRAIDRIRIIKKRNDKKPFLVLASSLAMVKKYCFVSQPQKEYLRKIWPGPFTVILKSRGNLPSKLTVGEPSLAVRLPKNKFLATIITRAGLPLVSTSLNGSGEAQIEDIENLDKYFNNLPDLVILAKNKPKLKPSKIIDIRDLYNIKVIRN